MNKIDSKNEILDCFKSEKGNALFLIFIAITLFAALSYAVFGGSRGQSTTSQQSFRVIEEVYTQVQGIRSAILECVLVYPEGGYPADPVSGLVKDMTCPGNNDRGIWTGSGARFLPPPPRPFNDWTYINDDNGTSGTGIRITTTTSSTDQGVIAGLTQLDNQFGANEADIVTSVTPSLTVWIVRN